MRTALLIVLCLGILSLACTTAAPQSDARPELLWIGAHPDDELFAAPLLRELCGTRYRCRFLVLTRGERGACRRADCGDLGTTRSRELVASAALFDAKAEQWRLVDGSSHDPSVVLDHWSAMSGNCATLLQRMKAALDGARMVITFDATHGTTQHGDHRAVAMLVRSSVAAMATPPALYTIHNEARLTRGGSDIRFLPSPPETVGALSSRQRSWKALLDVAEQHASQFDETALTLLRETPPEARTVVSMPREPVIGSWCRIR